MSYTAIMSPVPLGCVFIMGRWGCGSVCSGGSGNYGEQGAFGQENPEPGHMDRRLACVFVDKQFAPLLTCGDKIHYLPLVSEDLTESSLLSSQCGSDPAWPELLHKLGPADVLP